MLRKQKRVSQERMQPSPPVHTGFCKAAGETVGSRPGLAGSSMFRRLVQMYTVFRKVHTGFFGVCENFYCQPRKARAILLILQKRVARICDCKPYCL